MTDGTEKLYRFDSLASYRWSDRLRIRFADILFYLAIRAIGATIRWNTEGIHHLDNVHAAGKLPIYCLWHDRIFAGTYFLRDRRIVVITSQSLDGEYIARFLKRFGFGTVRGSSSRGGVKAMVEMIRSMRKGVPMAFTVDGPRGPRYEAKKGAVLLAKKTGNPMVPFSVELDRSWRVGSWDRMQIPKPFTRANFVVSDPIYVSQDADEEEVRTCQQKLQDSLDRLVAAGQSWKGDL